MAEFGVPQAAEYLFANWLEAEDPCVWIGSGLSLRDYPTWHTALTEVCAACDVDAPRIDEEPAVWMRVADECKDNEPELYRQTLRDLFGPEERAGDRRAYSLLWNLELNTYVTTNFDPLLYERSVNREDSEEYILREVRAATLGRDSKKAYYLHGLAHPDYDPEFVFSESEFDMAYNDPDLLSNFVEEVLRGYDILFVGCRLYEPALQPAFDRAKGLLEHLEERQEDFRIPNHTILKDVPLEDSADRASDELKVDEDKRIELKDYYEGLGLDVVWYRPEDPTTHFEVEDILRTVGELNRVGRPNSSR